MAKQDAGYKATGYTFRGKGSTKGVRQYINANQVFDQGGNMTGKNVAINIAQDHVDPEQAQGDTRLQYHVYDPELAKKTGNNKGVDNTVAMSAKQWESIQENGELVEHGGHEYLTYESDIIFRKEGGAVPNTKTVKPMEVPFDKDRHDELTALARTESKKSKTTEATKEKEVEDELEP